MVCSESDPDELEELSILVEVELSELNEELGSIEELAELLESTCEVAELEEVAEFVELELLVG